MIYCKLKGGLGNMFFQIAAAKAIAIDCNTDCSFPNLDSHLHYLNSDKTYNPSLKHSNEYKDFLGHLNTSPHASAKTAVYPFEYTPSPLFKEDVIIDGFFQSEKYFVTHREEILDFLTPSLKTLHTIIVGKYKSIIKGKTTSIHVRRGDYVKHPNHHPVQSVEYYNEAIELVKDKTDRFIIFSDDIQWCKDNLKVNNSVYIQNEKDYIELYLMSFCNNNIIANSSFSWWGAWLNRNENKIVIGPSKWFGPAIKHDTSDILPKSWIKI